MTEVVIRNKQLLNKLDSFVDELMSLDPMKHEKAKIWSSQKALDKPEWFCDMEYLEHMWSMGDKHSGFPEEHMSMPISHMVREYPKVWTPLRDKVKYDFASEIGAHTSALLNYYPPGGFVGWHTNWNAHCYQILFTWSKEGDGYFRYWDNEKKEIVHIPDVPGWQCRHYYFGRRDEPDHHCWHAAYAGSDRVTLAYKYVNTSLDHPDNDLAIEMRDEFLEEVQTES